MIEIIPIETPSLGDRSYLAHDGSTAVVIDPQRDIDRMLHVAGSRQLRIAHVFETHVHNDYITGGLALARQAGAAYHVNAADHVAFSRSGIRDGDVIEVSPGMRMRVLSTPGHTFTHLSYVLEGPGQPPAVFTGGSLLYGSTGRPDLLGAAHATELARAQYASAHRLAAGLPEEADVYPTHGFGSFCAATQAEGGNSSTIGREREVNPVLTLSQQEYVERLLAGLDAYPAYYVHMGPANAAGPTGADLSPPRHADAAGLRRRIQAGEWVVDLRTRTAFAAGHVTGALNFGIDGEFATYLGWLIPWGTPVTLLGDTPGQVARAQRDLSRIGIDRPAVATGSPAEWAGGQPLRSFPVADFAALAAACRHRPAVVLDVRRDREWADSHIGGAIHIPLHELPGRLSAVPDGEVWIHCRTGYRASIAASILDVPGRAVVVIDDDYLHAASAGLPISYHDHHATHQEVQ
jgi:hydroxyacylglutathione hydrolase